MSAITAALTNRQSLSLFLLDPVDRFAPVNVRVKHWCQTTRIGGGQVIAVLIDKDIAYDGFACAWCADVIIHIDQRSNIIARCRRCQWIERLKN